ncbi:hypothetical protein KY284_005569 [Solanum tuberosum]|nr:hypothetical protein KY284_005569 [Solanum tuberosum]
MLSVRFEPVTYNIILGRINLYLERLAVDLKLICAAISIMTRFAQDVSKYWMDLPRYGKEYINGVQCFLDFAYTVGDPQGEEIQCPCAECCNIRWYRRNVIYDHLICYGFVKGYTRWINHGEWDIVMKADSDKDDEVNSNVNIDGKSVTASYLKIDEEISKFKQQYADDVASIRSDIQRLKEEVRELRHFMSVLVQNNPVLDVQDVVEYSGSNLLSRADANSAGDMRGQNLSCSSESTH